MVLISMYSKVTAKLPPLKYKVKPAVLAAFIRPLDIGLQRVIDLGSASNQFKDVPAGSAVEKTSIEIPRKFLVSNFDDGQESQEAFYNNFEVWLEENGLKKEAFFFDAALRQIPHATNILTMIFANLTDDELARISLPLDIAKKLYAK